jgi:hypothetical protein
VWSSAPITFTVTGPVDVFEGNPVTENTVAGKIGIILKSKNAPGTITITASSASLTSATLTLTSALPDTSALPFIWTGTGVNRKAPGLITARDISIRQTRRAIIAALPQQYALAANITLINAMGKTIACPIVRKETSVIINTAGIAPGVYRLLIEASGRLVSKTVTLAK